MLRTEIGPVFCVPTFLTMQLGWIAGGDKMETNSQFQLVGPSFVPTPIPKEEKTVSHNSSLILGQKITIVLFVGMIV